MAVHPNTGSTPTILPFDCESEPSTIASRWEKWLNRFDNYIVAMNITTDIRKKALLLHLAGEKVHEIYETLGQPGDNFNTTKRVLNTHFTPMQDPAMAVYTFREAAQKEGETIDQFTTRLRGLAKHCGFVNNNVEIRAQILQKTNDKQLRREILKHPTWLLDDVLKEARSLENSECRASNIEGDKSTNKIRVEHRSRSQQPRRQNQKSKFNRSASRSRPPPKPDAKKKQETCNHCGYKWPHRGGQEKCPARDQTCYKCQKVGHFAGVCRGTKKTQVHAVQSVSSQYSDEPREREYVNSTQDRPKVYVYGIKGKNLPVAEVKIDVSEVSTLLDSGAGACLLEKTTYERMKAKNPKLVLQKPKVDVYAYGSHTPLPQIGCIYTPVTVKGKTIFAYFCVIDGNHGNILSREVSEELGLLTINCSLRTGPRLEPGVALYEKQFPGLFTGPGRIKDKQVQLHIDKTVAPKQQKHRRIPFHIREDVEKELERLEAEDIVEKVEGPTPWINPIVVVPKKSGAVRICVDMREANKAIMREKHLMPTIDDLRNDLNGARIFSVLDLRSAYHQLELAPESRYITTFTTHVGLRRYKRLMFGINAAAEVFQNAVAEMLSDLGSCRNISDDVIVWGTDMSDHDQNLLAVLRRLHEQGVRLNAEKCRFRQRNVTFFGHVFGDQGISVDPTKVESIIGTPPPQNVSELKSFLGMTQYVASFVPRYSIITAPLRVLTSQDAEWKWTNEQQEAFDQIKKALTSSPVMEYFDPHKHTKLIVDASPVGLGAILMQEHVVAYGSRALSDTESRYSQTERELLAIVWAVEHFHLYVYGSSFLVQTDHKPLLGIINSQKPLSARLERLKLRLLPYDIQLQYKPGKNPENPADYMSRHPDVQSAIPVEDTSTELYVNYVCSNAIPKAMTLLEVKVATKQDEHLQKLIKAIETDVWTDEALKGYVKQKHELSVCSGVVLRGTRIIIPQVLQERAVDLAHLGHQGVVKTKSLIREKVWFLGIDRLVEAKIKSCIPCQAATPAKPMEPLKMTKLPQARWQEVSIDFCGPFPSGEYALVVIDNYSRFPEVELLSTTSAAATIPKLDMIFARQGNPEVMTSDNGPPFNSKEFAMYAEVEGIRHRKVTPLWPQANGEAERFMQPLQKAIRTAHTEGKNWRRTLCKFLRNYRAAPHGTTGIPPFDALQSRKMRTVLPELSMRPQGDEEMRERDRREKEKMKQYADHRANAKQSDLKPGDTVLVRQPKENKLSTPYDPKPYQVQERKGSMVTARRDDKSITRNTSFFKKIPQPEINPEQDQDIMSDSQPEILPQDSQVMHELARMDVPKHVDKPVVSIPKYGTDSQSATLASPVLKPALKSPEIRRSTRERKAPVRFKDFV